MTYKETKEAKERRLLHNNLINYAENYLKNDRYTIKEMKELSPDDLLQFLLQATHYTTADIALDPDIIKFNQTPTFWRFLEIIREAQRYADDPVEFVVLIRKIIEGKSGGTIRYNYRDEQLAVRSNLARMGRVNPIILNRKATNLLQNLEAGVNQVNVNVANDISKKKRRKAWVYGATAAAAATGLAGATAGGAYYLRKRGRKPKRRSK